MPPAARVTDMHVCPMVTPGVPPIPHVGGPILPPGVPTVLIGFLPAATVTNMATCVGPPDIIAKGSTGVFINFLPAARLGDTCAHGGTIILGEPTVMIGEIGSPSPGAGGAGAVMAGLVVAGLLNPANAGSFSALLSAAGAQGTAPSNDAAAAAPDAGTVQIVPSTVEDAASASGEGGGDMPAPPVPPPVLDPGCVSAAAASQKLVDDTSARVDKLIGDSQTPVHSHFWSSTATKCQARASEMQPVIDRFQRYSAALPSARACLSVNQIGDGDGTSGPATPCLKRLPDNAAALSNALGLKPPLTDEDLRDNKSGFRAAIYQSETDGKLILVARDTEPNSLVDWKTNTDNGLGRETKQYDEMRKLTSILTMNNVKFDMAGYSKAGGLAQEAGLINTSGSVTVFNSAGIPDASSGRTATTSLQNLASRTTAFSTDGDFLTFVNQTSDPAQQIANAQYLKDQLAANQDLFHPIGLSYLDPETINTVDPTFAAAKSEYLKGLQEDIDNAKDALAAGNPMTIFPPVRADSMNVIPNSMTNVARAIDVVGDPIIGAAIGGVVGGAAIGAAIGAVGGAIIGAVTNINWKNLAMLKQHQMEVVEPAMEKTVKDDADTMSNFLKDCS